MLKRGDILMVYVKPWTMEQPEGKARLLRRLDGLSINGMERWLVRFIGNEVGSAPVERTVREVSP